MAATPLPDHHLLHLADKDRMRTHRDHLNDTATERHLRTRQSGLAILQRDDRSGLRQTLIDGQIAGGKGTRDAILPRRQNIDNIRRF